MKFDKDSERRIRRACETARLLATDDGTLTGIRRKRFHRAMDALSQDEGEEVSRRLHEEPWFQAAKRKLRFS